ncbi:hypothetical protein [Marinigracilibium pacificum]|uniref:Lipoprotein n=1 Tax=Marinigracilibium pacificum TaxID=2729599 RepID=A0A848J052_9BACT|nr:hypothetical protein [Marinigracilibium pacificum]NMM47639.1 hypothetical protein [Marinigracilibium pacificum]
MTKLIVTILFIFSTFYSIGCTCSDNIKNDFISNVKNFDAIIIGKFIRDSDSKKGVIVISDVLKGTIDQSSINIYEGGIDCTEIFLESDNEIIIGLNIKETGNNDNVYFAPSCITSVLRLENGSVSSITDGYNIHISNPKVKKFRTIMDIKKFKHKIKKKL